MAVETLTFGCRLNTVESEVIRLHAEAEGRDRIVVNTCAVTAEAGRQARKAIRKLARERPGAEIVVTGCGAQVETETYAAMPEVARLVGNDAKLRPETWPENPGDAGERIAVDDIMAIRSSAATRLAHLPGHTRAFVPVQNGCDHRCTFCVIPFGRGNSRSVPFEAVVEQVARLVDHGGREVVLTGVDLTAYGRDLFGDPALGRLVRTILARVPDLARLRLSSIDSVEADPALMEALASEPRLMPHLHLSLQAGDDLVLKRMKRRHSRDDAIRFCEDARRLRPAIVFGADLIAGFPTETEAQFSRSLDLVRECGLTHLHVFPYSPRPETPAARMPSVAPEIVRERAARLREAGAAALVRHLAGEVGQRHRVLTEREGVGRTEGFTPVRMDADAPAGMLRDVAIAGHDGRMLIASRDDPPPSAGEGAPRMRGGRGGDLRG